MRLREVFCFLLLISILVMRIPSCHAQSIDPVEVLSSSLYYQGDDGFIEVWIKNNGSAQVGITLVRVHFNWTEEPNIFNLSLDSMVNIDVGVFQYIGKINFTVPTDATVGNYNYYLYIEFDSPLGGEKHTWQTSNYTVWVENRYKKLCDDFVFTVWYKIINARQNVTNAQSAIQFFGSPQNQEANSFLLQAQSKLEEAQIYLSQAENANSTAVSFYKSGAFQDAYTSFQECANASDNASTLAAEASSLIAQAQQKETVYQQQKQAQQVMTLGIPIVLTIVAFVVIILLLMKRRRV